MFAPIKIEYKSEAQMLKMREAGLVTSRLLDSACESAAVGVQTREIDTVVRGILKKYGAVSNFLGYQGYPATVCVSVNDQVVHGIPGKRELEEGDLVSIDGGAVVNRWHGDSARTVIVGDSRSARAPQHVKLNEAAEEAMWAGIAAMASAHYVSEIGDAIEDAVRQRSDGYLYGIVEDYTGHGIGSSIHQPPNVSSCRGGRNKTRIKNGMCLAIEPMLTLGGIETGTLADGWTVVTSDNSYAAHWEHSVAKHERGIWVLTDPDGGADRLAKYGVEPVLPKL